MNILPQLFSFREAAGSHRLMTFIVLSGGILNFFFGEIVPAGGGLGWDGQIYAAITRSLPSMISEGQLSSYHAQRILPSAIVRGMLIASHAELTNINIIRGFEIYNLVLLLIGLVVWRRLADYFSVSVNGRWVGFAGIYLTYFISKQMMYYPVLTDVTGMLIGMLLLLFYLEKRPLLILLTTLVGSFAWQVTGFYGAILLLSLHGQFPRSEENAYVSGAGLAGIVKFGWISLLGGSVILYAALLVFSPSDQQGEQGHHLQRFVTGAPSLVGVVIGLSMLAGSIEAVRSVIISCVRVQVIYLAVLAAIGVAVPRVIVSMISDPQLPPAGGFVPILGLVIFPEPNGMFLMPLVTLTVFWGPTVLLLIIYWKEICVELRRLGPGAVGVIGLTLPLTLATEPRFVIGAWAFVIMALVRFLERSEKTPRFDYAFWTLTILYAQFWMRFNFEPWTGGDMDGLFEFPKQMFFMHYGPWMSWSSYVLQLAFVVVSILLLRRTVDPFKNPARHSNGD
jgi:hypothetical protein